MDQELESLLEEALSQGYSPLQRMTDTDFAYLAGILDGEGAFMVMRNSGGGGAIQRVEVASTSPKLMEWLRNKFPGVSCGTSYSATSAREAASKWSICDRGILCQLLPHVIPYLTIKQVHAKLLLKYCETFRFYKQGVKLSDEEAELREAYVTLFKILNGKGPGSYKEKKSVMEELVTEGIL